MDTPHILDLEQDSWQPHPTVAGVLTKTIESRMTHPYADALLAKVIVGGEIPWHVHETASKTAYILQGTGTLLFAETAMHEAPSEATLKPGVALTIPGGWWHSVVNTGDEPLILFAFHTPPTL
ncbi:MAG: cupin domain-containing protein [Chloroflexota bacterium]